MSQAVNYFGAILSEAVDESLLCLGESVRASIYFHIERNYALKKDEVTQRFGDFCSAIQGIFGVGASVLEKLILKRLCEKCNISYENLKDEAFQVAIQEVRRARHA
jgi:protein-arginine kinase activator protein McsA